MSVREHHGFRMATNKEQFTGDGCGRDQNGYYWIRGRVDDVVNVSGHRLSTAEIEAALIEHRQYSLSTASWDAILTDINCRSGRRGRCRWCD